MGNINAFGHGRYAVRKVRNQSALCVKSVSNATGLFQIAVVELWFCEDNYIVPRIVEERISNTDFGKVVGQQVGSVLCVGLIVNPPINHPLPIQRGIVPIDIFRDGRSDIASGRDARLRRGAI